MPDLDLSRYLDLFVSEGREHAAALGAALLELDASPSSVDAITRAFRAVHTLKGMAAAMGFDALAERAHVMESALDPVRAGSERMTAPLLAHLLEEADALARGVEEIAHPADASTATSTTATTTTSARSADATGGADVARTAGVDAERYVRVRANRLDALTDLAAEVDIALRALDRALPANARSALDDPVRLALGDTLRAFRELREQILTTRMVPAGQLFSRFPRLVRETARTLGKDVDFVLDGGEVELDRSVLDQVGDPVMHLLRNAIDHGIEAPDARERAGKPARGRLTLSVQREAGFAVVRVADDGRGIARDAVRARAIASGVLPSDAAVLDDAALLHVLTRAGFSTADHVTEISGRGVGLDVVDAAASGLGGTLELRTVEGRGTAITLRLPLSVAVVRALLARVGSETYAIPFTHVEETLALPDAGEPIGADAPPMVALHDRLGAGAPSPRRGSRGEGVTVRARGRRVTLVVDEFVGQQDVVVKRFDVPRGATIPFAGATVLADGAPALIVDVNAIV